MQVDPQIHFTRRDFLGSDPLNPLIPAPKTPANRIPSQKPPIPYRNRTRNEPFFVNFRAEDLLAKQTCSLQKSNLQPAKIQLAACKNRPDPLLHSTLDSARIKFVIEIVTKVVIQTLDQIHFTIGSTLTSDSLSLCREADPSRQRP